MFSKGNTNRPRQAGLHQFGLMDVPDISGMEDNIYGKDDDDGDFEAELAALTAGHEYVRPKRKAPKQDLFVDLSDLDKIGEDIPDDELSGGDDDPDLLAELASLEAEAMPAPIAPPIQPRLTQQHAAGARPAPPIPTAGSRPAPPIPTAGLRPAPSIPTAGSLVAPPAPAPPQRTAAGRNSPDAEDAASGATDIMTLLTQRLHMYTEAAGHAKALGESSKARRFQRGIQRCSRIVRIAIALFACSLGAVSRQEQQMAFLVERHNLFREAALDAKRHGELTQAKEHLRKMKGFEPMMDACRNGLPVDMSKVPVPPQLKVSPSSDMPTQSVAGSGESDREKLYNKLEEQLIQQTKVCSKNSQHYMQLGDVGSASKYDKMAEGCKKDLDALRHAFKHGDPVPKFHYDNRTMSVVQSCLDLGDNDMELIIVRGINYSSSTAPKDLDTYIRWEFPYPSDTPPQGKISTVKDTNNPEYNAKVKLQINRKSRSFLRLVKRHYIKLEVFAKGGFLRGDTSLGSVKVPLQPLETHCIVHQSYDMMDGRKAVGGRVEVKLRIRDPFVSKQVEETKEKWLIIDQWLRSSPSKGPLQTPM
ncbi:PREDICTED: coiled-coil and C2 domain-containing protein 1-like [Priapulus caudatus]|uniref:Coiled-coil and C2 domain-containing protein 1-like n=1 Tax=Priapulus caudatus TaxID=37621 RepID=A0ABM1E8P8_PRICU|nr:PREDICTED: coiled-coil and C2 domain-containing protein 1-like [Priapulus caudatus]